MAIRPSAAGFAFFIVITSSPLHAADVVVKGVHLCCGSCLSAAREALGAVDQVTKITADLNTKIVSFSAPDRKAAAAGIKALARAGFFGTATLGREKLKFPDTGVKKGMKSNAVTLTGVHLCCGSCVTATQKAMQKVRGVAVIDVDRNAGKIKLTGDGIVITEAIAALNQAGFYGKPGQ